MVSLALVLNEDGSLKKDLMTFQSLQSADNYTTKLNDSKDIKKEFASIIKSFLENNQSYLTKRKNNYQGRICLISYDNQNNIRFFPILYKQNSKLSQINYLKSAIKEKLNDDIVLEEIFKRKKYLLSKNELSLLNLYLRLKDIKYKKLFISSFYLRISKNSNCYLYLRSLINVCGLLNKTNSNFKELTNHLEVTDEFLMRTLAETNYENLYHYYDLDELSRISINKDIPVGSKSFKKD